MNPSTPPVALRDATRPASDQPSHHIAKDWMALHPSERSTRPARTDGDHAHGHGADLLIKDAKGHRLVVDGRQAGQRDPRRPISRPVAWAQPESMQLEQPRLPVPRRRRLLVSVIGTAAKPGRALFRASTRLPLVIET